jgi:hypothetical protein
MCKIPIMTTTLADENACLKARLAETEAALADAIEAQRRLESIVSELRREKFGPRSEKLDPKQFNLPLEDVELAHGVLEAAQEKARRALKRPGPAECGTPKRNRGHLPKHLPRVERVIEPATTLCPCGCGEMARIGEVEEDQKTVQWTVFPTTVRTSRCRAGATAGSGHAPPEICLPSVLRRGGPGPCPGTRRARRAAHRGVDRPGHGGEVRRPSSILPPGRNLHPAGDHTGPGHAWQLGRSRLLPSAPDRRSSPGTAEGRGPDLHGRNPGAGPRSRATKDQDRLLLGDRLR